MTKTSEESQKGSGGMGMEPSDSDLTLASQQQRKHQLVHQANLLHKAGRMEDLERLLEEVLTLDPKDAQALFNLGIIAFKRDDRPRAERMLRRAIIADPDYIEAYQTLGDIFYQSRHLISAIEVYEKGLAKVPTRLPLLAALLRCAATMRVPSRVEAVSRRILNIDDEDINALNYLAWSALRLNGNLHEARAAVEKALAKRPDAPNTLAMAESVADRMGDEAAAASFRDRLTAVVTDSWEAAHFASEIFSSIPRIERSAEVVRRYLEHHPDEPAAHRYLAVTLMHEADFVGSHRILEQVLTIVPDRPNLQMVYCLNAFRLNDLETFFKFHHTRWTREGAEKIWDLPVPMWDGKPIKNGKLVVQCEQGVGDYVMFAVCFPGLRDLARDVIIKAMSRMQRLLQRSFPDMLVIPDAALPPDVPQQSIAAKTTAGDLPQLLGGDLEHLPGKAGVLVADPVGMQQLRKKYREMFPGKRLIGISWRSGNRDSAAVRSLELPHWKPIFDLSDCAFISLQYGDITRDLDELKAQVGDRVYWDESVNPMGDMDPFAAQVAAMDLIVSVDNSTIHFAGGLGKPCWAMLPLNADWRWQVDRTDNIWYDSVELFRPEKDGAWEELVERVAKRLAAVDDKRLQEAEIAYLHRSLKTMMQAGRVSEAEQYGRMLLASGEHKAEAMQAIAHSAAASGRGQDAVSILHRATELDQGNASIQADLAYSLSKTEDPEEALRFAREVTRRFPKSNEASIACGRILADLGRHDEATDFFARVLRREPQNVLSRLALASLQAVQAEWELARGNFSRVLETDPSNAAAHTALGEIDLRQENWAAGWENFRWRFGVRPGTLPVHIAGSEQLKPWVEGSLRKQRLLLHAERSMSEQLLFTQILNDVVKESRRITLECEPALQSLLAENFPAVEFVARRSLDDAGVAERKIQLISSLGTLAARFRAAAEDFPTEARPYLSANKARTAELRADYASTYSGRRLIGLCWRHQAATEPGVPRLTDWLPLVDRPDLGVIALHPDRVEVELSTFATETGRDLIHDRRIDFSQGLADYAAQIAACDIVISVGDVTTVLAAAVGRPVIKLRQPVDRWWWGAGEGLNPWFRALHSIMLNEPADRIVARVLALVDRIGTAR
jgi:tetratricopeptide (TPR) repeat protein